MYEFRLQPVLNQRESIEENLKKETAACKARLAEEKKKLHTYKNSKSKLLAELNRKKQENSTISEILLYVDFAEQVSNDIEKQKRSILGVQEIFNQRREELIEAVKSRKTIEKIKEKELDTYKLKVIKNEQRFLDEVAVYRFNAGT
jgi:flagellar FliJ protein